MQNNAWLREFATQKVGNELRKRHLGFVSVSLAGSRELLSQGQIDLGFGHRGSACSTAFHAPNMRMIQRAAILECFGVVL